jgi:hypothetical protein
MEQKESKSSRHFYISLAKSTLRLLGCILLMQGNLLRAGTLFFIAECLGIAEEL